MRRALFLLTLVAAMVLACASVVLAQQNGGRTPPDREQQEDQSERGQQRQDEVRPGNYIVVLRDDADSQQVAQEHSEQYAAKVGRIYEHALRGYAAMIPDNQLDRVRADENVELVEQDRVMRLVAPPPKSKDESTSSTATTPEEVPTGVRRILGGSALSSADLPRTAVIDTGIQLSNPDKHPDLNAIAGANFVDGNPFRCGQKSGGGNDDNGHGTHVAGTIGAIDNEEGVVGVLPGAPVVAVKVLGSNGSGYTSDIVCGIDWVTKQNTDSVSSNDIKVANMSLGGSGSAGSSCDSKAMRKAICGSTKAGVTYVVAAGNSSKDLKDFEPAAYPEVLTVTAIADSNGEPYETGDTWDQSTGCGKYTNGTSDTSDDYWETEDSAADFSNYATRQAEIDHTIAAPGRCINSTWPQSLGDKSGYKMISGTSMASPHIAGAVARYKASNPSATPAQIIAKLREDAKNKSDTSWENKSETSPYYGFTDDPYSPNGLRYYGYLGLGNY